MPDILIAATAELANLVVLHDDKDYELIAEITGQPLERLPARSLTPRSTFPHLRSSGRFFTDDGCR